MMEGVGYIHEDGNKQIAHLSWYSSLGGLVLFYGLSTHVSYSMPNLVIYTMKSQFSKTLKIRFYVT